NVAIPVLACGWAATEYVRKGNVWRDAGSVRSAGAGLCTCWTFSQCTKQCVHKKLTLYVGSYAKILPTFSSDSQHPPVFCGCTDTCSLRQYSTYAACHPCVQPRIAPLSRPAIRPQILEV